MNDLNYLNVAALVSETRVLGPGRRFGIWVQGCPFSCPGCIAPEWIPQRQNQILSVDELVQEILVSNPDGLTISGGEPFLQAPALAHLVREVRLVRKIDVILFSGFTLSALKGRSHAVDLLSQIDLLIDGSYVTSRNSNKGLRGSDNQQFHFLTDRLRHREDFFLNYPRQVELHFQGDALLVVGIPPHNAVPALDLALRIAQEKLGTQGNNFSLNMDWNPNERS